MKFVVSEIVSCDCANADIIVKCFVFTKLGDDSMDNSYLHERKDFQLYVIRSTYLMRKARYLC